MNDNTVNTNELNDSTCNDTTKNDIYIKKSFNYGFQDIVVVLCYIIVLGSLFFKFIPISDKSWFVLGMGKYISFATLVGIYTFLKRNYFASFFISTFTVFFLFHEIIIFYDSYAIDLGKELTQDGVFRSVVELFKDAFTIKCGAYYTLIGSVTSLITIIISWLLAIVKDNKKASELAN